MSGRNLLEDSLLDRAELLAMLPEKWPGLSLALDKLERKGGDRLTIVVVRRLLASAAETLAEDEGKAKRAALLELIKLAGGAIISREAHEARVSELLDANGRELERGREARAEVVLLREAVRRFGDRARMATVEPMALQQAIDRAFEA